MHTKCSKARETCVRIYIMSMWWSLINAGASSVGEIVILNNEVSVARAVLQQHEYTQTTSRVVCHQESNINPSNHWHHHRIGLARSATCVRGGEGLDWWPQPSTTPCCCVITSVFRNTSSIHPLTTRFVRCFSDLSSGPVDPFFLSFVYGRYVGSYRRRTARTDGFPTKLSLKIYVLHVCIRWQGQ